MLKQLMIATTIALSGVHTGDAKTITIAVIDTGIDPSVGHLCKYGHKDFTNSPFEIPSPLRDDHGHGTHIAGLIKKYAGEGNYCLVAIKYYKESNSGAVNLKNMLEALRYAINIKADFINISGGGPEANPVERDLVKKALDQKTTLVFAAGNEGEDLDKKCSYFPACYFPDKVSIVGNLLNRPAWVPASYTGSNPINSRSNYGKVVNHWEVGTDVESNSPSGKLVKMTGTSQATAIVTGKLVKERLSK